MLAAGRSLLSLRAALCTLHAWRPGFKATGESDVLMPEPLPSLALPPAQHDAVSPSLVGAYPSALRHEPCPAPSLALFALRSIVTAAAGINSV